MSLFKENLVTRLPQKCKDLHVHKWTKNDTLDKVAKTFGLPNGKAIWVDPPNKAIIKARKKPEDLKPGDKVIIPIASATAKKLRAEADKYNTVKRAYVAYANVLEGKIAELEKKLEKTFTIVDKLNRRKFDANEAPKVLKVLITVTDPVFKFLEPIAKAKTPFGILQLNRIQTYQTALKRQHALMKGGSLDDVNLETLRKVIEGLRKEISSLRTQIKKLDDDLTRVGQKTIMEWCKIRSVSPFAKLVLKDFLK